MEQKPIQLLERRASEGVWLVIVEKGPRKPYGKTLKMAEEEHNKGQSVRRGSMKRKGNFELSSYIWCGAFPWEH